MISRSLKRYVLQEWRGLPDSSKPDRQVAVSDLVSKLVGKLGLGERISEAEIGACWKEIVGPFLAEHSTPAKLVDGILQIQVLQPTVRFELERNWKKEILSKLQQRFGKKVIREVRFRL